MEQTLNLLVVSDIHLHYENVERVVQWCGQTATNIDYILVPGDTGKVDYKEPQALATQPQARNAAERVFKMLQQLNRPIIYIPGNHDDLLQFENKKISPQSQCIHKHHIKLRDDLTIFGFGGSLPAHNKQWEKIWEGYPFLNEEQFDKEWEQWEKGFSTDTQKILVTHVGPYNSPTTFDVSNGKYFSGAKIIDKLLEKEKIVVLVHGHTHYSPGFVRVCDSPVLNPGSLTDGRFSLLKLRRREKWQVMEATLVTL